MTRSLLCCALSGWLICVKLVRCERSTVHKCNKHQTTNVTSNAECIAVTSQPYISLTFRSLQRSVTLPASQTLQHNLCVKHGKVRSARGSCQGSGLCCYSRSIETSRESTDRTRDAQRNTWMTDRQTDTETLKLKVISHGNETEAGSGAVTPYTEPQRHPSVRDGHVSASSHIGLKYPSISSIICLSVCIYNCVYLSSCLSVYLSII